MPSLLQGTKMYCPNKHVLMFLFLYIPGYEQSLFTPLRTGPKTLHCPQQITASDAIMKLESGGK